MYLKTVFIRFYKSFNYDFLRKNHEAAKPSPWELIDGKWFPFVRVPLARDVTTIVGANESGKSHLLTAIEKGLSGEGVAHRDFCRYSQFFTVEKGKMRSPDFGFELAELSAQEQTAVRGLTGILATTPFDTVFLFRLNSSEVKIWILETGTYKEYPVKDASALESLVPSVFHINSSVGLPDTVPLSWLRQTSRPLWKRKERHGLIEAFANNAAHFASEEKLRNSVKQILPSFTPFIARNEEKTEQIAHEERLAKECELAKDLMFTVAKIDPKAIEQLHNALAAGDEGLVNGILQQFNERLANSLNFPKWWVQDRDFQLVVSARDDDLVFTIRDRTHTEYCFAERSGGLKYFLSYYIQFLAHIPPTNRHELLLMDEPDAYLSSQGQQDLLKIFNAFAKPEDTKTPIQVIYVTHSPFCTFRENRA